MELDESLVSTEYRAACRKGGVCVFVWYSKMLGSESSSNGQ